MNDNYFEKCQLLLNKISKQNKQMIKLQLDFADLKKENEQLKQRNEFLKKQLDRVCDENEIMGDKLKQIGRML